MKEISWGVAKNKRSLQSKQHRGRGLFSHRKPKKIFVDAHMNIHYNRAHIKNYTIFSFLTNRRRNLTDLHLGDALMTKHIYDVEPQKIVPDLKISHYLSNRKC